MNMTPTTLPTQAEYLSRSAAAKLIRDRYGLRLSSQTLAKYATIGGGPPYYKAGRQCLYREGDLMAWAEARIAGRRASTSAPIIEHAA